MSTTHRTPIYSMTGFGIESLTLPQCILTMQLKSVNSRYLDLSFKIPDELAAFEAPLRDAIAAQVKRGKLECKISWQAQLNNESAVEINPAALERALALQTAILQIAPNAQPMTVQQLLQQPNVLPSSLGAGSALSEITLEHIQTLAQSTLAAFLNARANEGAHLSQTLTEKVAQISLIIKGLKDNLPKLLEVQFAKLNERLFKAVDAQKNDNAIATSAIPADELIERIKFETSVTATRIDVAEELDRLDGHIANTKDILQNGSNAGVGKKLDFLMQEFNREANTLGSKSASLLQTQAAMDLKFIIEQMREQVQNIE